MPRLHNFPWFDHHNNVQMRVQGMVLLILLFSRVFCNFFPFESTEISSASWVQTFSIRVPHIVWNQVSQPSQKQVNINFSNYKIYAFIQQTQRQKTLNCPAWSVPQLSVSLWIQFLFIIILPKYLNSFSEISNKGFAKSSLLIIR